MEIEPTTMPSEPEKQTEEIEPATQTEQVTTEQTLSPQQILCFKINRRF